MKSIERAVPFVIADVFSNRPFGGNQLAVFPDATGLAPAQMQALAREFNFAESTFVFPPVRAESVAHVRIFTPRAELPFAGHPTVGTAAVLTSLDRIALRDGRATVILDEGVGPVRVDIERNAESADGSGIPRAIMGTLILETQVELPVQRPAHSAVAAALSLPVDTVLDSWFAGVGFLFCFVHLRDKATVDRAALDRHAWSAQMAGTLSPHLFMFAGDLSPDNRLYARMFAPALGVEEDAATGSASATLAGVAAGRLAERDGTFRWHVDQGVALGRPSVMVIGATKQGGRVTSVQVGGSTVIVGDGQIRCVSGTPA